MRNVDRKARKRGVGRTGNIPIGTQVHFSRLRNPSIAQILFQLRKTEAEMKSGACHSSWGRKQIEALQRMLDAKKKKFVQRRLKD